MALICQARGPPSPRPANPGQEIDSPNVWCFLVMQADGNLVERNRATGALLWSTGTTGSGNYAMLWSDGQLVVLNSSGTPIFGTCFPDVAGAYSLDLQNDENLVIYKPGGGVEWDRLGGCSV